MRAIVFERAGEPRDVLAVRDIPEADPGPGEVEVAVEASPVQPADFLFVRGVYRVRPALPQVAGLEGAGRVIASGDGAGIPVGARVAFRWPGAWAERVVVPASRATVVPDGVSVEAAAQFSLNPVTAWALLDEAAAPAGAWIGVTAATSTVAAMVAALAASRGLRVLGLARRGPAAGAAPQGAVLLGDDAPDLAGRVREATGGAGLSALLDSVGGPLVERLFPALAPGAVLVAYGTMSGEPASVRNATLVYGNLTWKGFGIDRWLGSADGAKRARMTDELWAAVESGTLPVPVRARFPFDAVREALADLEGRRGGGKVLLVPG